MTRRPGVTATRKRRRKLPPADLVKRRLLKMMRAVDAMQAELADLQSLLKVPTPVEYDRIEAGQRITLDALLLGVVYVAGFHLSEASLIIDDQAGRYPRRKLAKPSRVFLRDDVLRGLGRIVRKHAGKADLP